MPNFFRPVAIIALPVFSLLSACNEMSAAGGDGMTAAEKRAQRSCVRAVEKQTGIKGATPNNTLAVVEVNQYIVDVPKAKSWTCYTTDSGRPEKLIEFRA